jgi:hypothetical protein
MLNKKTRDVLKSLTSVTESFILETPRTIFVDEYKQVIGSLNTELLKEDFKEPVAINNMNVFLNMVGIIDDPKISINKRKITIKNDNSEIKYQASDVDSLNKVKYSIIESTKKFETVLNFKLSKELIQILNTASGIFSLNDTLEITKEGDSVTLALVINETFEQSSNEFSINVQEFESNDNDNSNDNNFVIKVPISSIKKLPNLDYNFEVKYNKDKDAYRIYASNILLEVVLSTIK